MINSIKHQNECRASYKKKKKIDFFHTLTGSLFFGHIDALWLLFVRSAVKRSTSNYHVIVLFQRNAFLKMLHNVGKQNIGNIECPEEELKYLEQVYAEALELLRKDVEVRV